MLLYSLTSVGNEFQTDIFTFLSHSHHCKALNSLICADVPLRNYSLTRGAAAATVKAHRASSVRVRCGADAGLNVLAGDTMWIIPLRQDGLDVVMTLCVSTAVLQVFHRKPCKVTAREVRRQYGRHADRQLCTRDCSQLTAVYQWSLTALHTAERCSSRAGRLRRCTRLSVPPKLINILIALSHLIL